MTEVKFCRCKINFNNDKFKLVQVLLGMFVVIVDVRSFIPFNAHFVPSEHYI